MHPLLLKEIKMTRPQNKIDRVLMSIINGNNTPTKIGLSLGYSYSTASSSVMNALKKLVTNGVITRLENPVRYVIINQDESTENDTTTK